MYDPMVAKLIVWDADREQATQRMLRALGEYEIERPQDADPVPQGAAGHRPVGQRRDLPRPGRGQGVAEGARLPAAGVPTTRRPERSSRTTPSRSPAALRRQGHRAAAGRRGRRRGNGAAPPPAARPPKKRGERKSGGGGGADELVSPLQGNIWKVLVKQGDTVEEGQLICIIEAMKMENEITAHKAGVIDELPITEGEPIAAGRPDRGHQVAARESTPAPAAPGRRADEAAEAVPRLLIALPRPPRRGLAVGQRVPRRPSSACIDDPATDFLLASPDDDAPPAGVAQLRFRYGIWRAARRLPARGPLVREELGARRRRRRAVQASRRPRAERGAGASSSTPPRPTRRRWRCTAAFGFQRDGERLRRAATCTCACTSTTTCDLSHAAE